MQFFNKNVKGFTLVEMLIVLAIFSSLFFLAIPVTSHYFTNSNFDKDILRVESLLKQTRGKSFSSYNNSSHGVYFDLSSKKFIFYQGESFALRDNNEDIEFELNSSLIVVSPPENKDINFLAGESILNIDIDYIFEDKLGRKKKILINKYGGIFVSDE